LASGAPISGVFQFAMAEAAGDMYGGLTASGAGDEGIGYVIDLSDVTQSRVIIPVQTPGVAGTKFRMQYSTNLSTWNPLTPIGAPFDVAGLQYSDWEDVAEGARGIVAIRPAPYGGDGVVSPDLNFLYVPLIAFR